MSYCKYTMVTSIQPGSAIKRCTYALQMKPNCAI